MIGFLKDLTHYFLVDRLWSIFGYTPHISFSLTSKSEQQLRTEFNDLDEVSARNFYIQILSEMRQCVLADDVDGFKTLRGFLNYVSFSKCPETVKNYQSFAQKSYGNINLVTFACKSKAVKVLEYLFSRENDLYSLPFATDKNAIFPNQEDDESHNAFYYAIRSNITALPQILIDMWPNTYFIENAGMLDDILSKAYKDLLLRNVNVTKDMEIYIKRKLVDIRFFNQKTPGDRVVVNSTDLIMQRIELVLENISFVREQFQGTEPNEQVLLAAKFVAKNINVLKSLLKSTYNKLPWEEMEFYLVAYIRCCLNRFKLDVVYNFVLYKQRLLQHLENFSIGLSSLKESIKTKDTGELSKPLLRLRREKAVQQVLENNILFKELYNDFSIIRDYYTLEVIQRHINWAISSDPVNKEGQLIVTRALQVTGEHMKDTLYSPKLSRSTLELLHSALPDNTKEIIADLRDSLSHTESLSRRLEIEDNVPHFFRSVQSDLAKIDTAIVVVMHNSKMGVIRTILREITASGNFDSVKDFLRQHHISQYALENELAEMKSFNMREIVQLEKLVSDLEMVVPGKSSPEQELFRAINDSIKMKMSLLEKHDMELAEKLRTIENMFSVVSENSTLMRFLTVFEKLHMPEFFVGNFLLSSSEEICVLLNKLLEKISSRIDGMDMEDRINVWRTSLKIVQFTNFHVGKIKSIKEFKQVVTRKRKKKSRIPSKLDERLKDQLSLKLALLRKVLNSSRLEDPSLKENCENNLTLQPLIEILVLDVFSIMENMPNHLSHNVFFLDCDYPMTNGKNLRNHLAHENALVKIVLGDDLTNAILNAEKITTEDILRTDRQIGKIVQNDPPRLKKSHDMDLSNIREQKKLFVALSYGDLKQAKNCISDGADVYGKDMNLQSSLHFAAKGPTIAIVKFVLQFSLDTDTKDINLQTALHAAATFGRVSTVKYFIGELNMMVDSRDINGRTPLHLASEKGHKDVVEVLLKGGAKADSKDLSGKSPLFYAVVRNCHEVACALLEHESDVDVHIDTRGSTALHAAAACGHLNLVNFLLEKNAAAVGHKSDKVATPLHLAASGGHVEIIKSLISKGADVNAKYDCWKTPLHAAVHDEATVSTLLKEGADVNAHDSVHHSPLLTAARFGSSTVARLLLENGGVTDVVSDSGNSPVHIAAMMGHRDLVDTLLNQTADIDAEYGNDMPPLLAAVVSGHLDTVRLLVDRGENIHTKWGEKGCTVLHYSALLGHTHIADILLEKGAFINAQDFAGVTALHLSAMNGNKDTVQFLLRKGADIRIKDKRGRTPLHMLVAKGLTELLIKEQIDISFAGDEDVTPLHLGASMGDLRFVKYCLAKGSDVRTETTADATALLLALDNNHIETANFLLEEGCDLHNPVEISMALQLAVRQNSQSFMKALFQKFKDITTEAEVELLNSAVRNGCEEATAFLLSRNAFEFKKLPLLYKAVSFGHVNVVGELIKAGFDVNSEDEGVTPLLCALAAENYELVQYLITKGADANKITAEGTTTLQFAVSHCSVEMVQILIRAGANDVDCAIEDAIHLKDHEIVQELLQHPSININPEGSNGFSLVHLAVISGSLEIMKCLVGKGADIEVDYNGLKPIHLAVLGGHVDIVKYLSTLGLSNYDLGEDNWSLLHWAVAGNQSGVCRFLLDKGTDVNTFDEDGITPFHFAAEMGNADIFNTLMHFGEYYEACWRNNETPLEIKVNQQTDISNSFLLISELFATARKDNPIKMEFLLSGKLESAGCLHAYVEIAKSMLLHYAARKGLEDITNVLLKYETNPNITTKNRRTPLHYASEFSYFGIVKSLLRSGAVFEAVCGAGKTPFEYATDGEITHLLTFLKETFRKTQNGDASVLEDLKGIADVDTAKAVMGAKDKEGRILTDIASGDMELGQLNQFLEDFLSHLELFELRDYIEAFDKYKVAIRKNMELCRLFGADIFERDLFSSKILFDRSAYKKSKDLLRNVYETKKVLLSILCKGPEKLQFKWV